MPLFNFRLRPLPDLLQGWESLDFEVPQYLSSWFWLTDGWYWVATSQGDIPVGHPDFQAASGLEPGLDLHLDYQVARFWQDLLDVSCDALEPLPEPFAGWVQSGAWAPWWSALPEQESAGADGELPFTAGGWWSARHLDMGYLMAPPVIRFWRVGNELTVEWDTHDKRVEGVLCWVEARGRLRLSVRQFQQELADFRERLDAAMRERLTGVEKLGLLDAGQLAFLHRQHMAAIAEKGRPAERVEWPEVLTAVRKLEQRSGLSLPR